MHKYKQINKLIFNIQHYKIYLKKGRKMLQRSQKYIRKKKNYENKINIKQKFNSIQKTKKRGMGC